MTKAEVTSKGQITLPKGVRTRLGLAPGDAVEFVEEGGDFRLRRHVGNSPFAPYRGYLSGPAGERPGRDRGGAARSSVSAALDTNVLLDLLIPDSHHAELASQFPSADELDLFLAQTRICLDPSQPQALWRAAQAWPRYLARRGTPFRSPSAGRAEGSCAPAAGETVAGRQRILSDFLVGGHASVQADRLLTRRGRLCGNYFPELRTVSPR